MAVKLWCVSVSGPALAACHPPAPPGEWGFRGKTRHAPHVMQGGGCHRNGTGVNIRPAAVPRSGPPRSRLACRTCCMYTATRLSGKGPNLLCLMTELQGGAGRAGAGGQTELRGAWAGAVRSPVVPQKRTTAVCRRREDAHKPALRKGRQPGYWPARKGGGAKGAVSQQPSSPAGRAGSQRAASGRPLERT